MSVRECTVDARVWWGATGITLAAAHRYDFTASGEWFDADIPAGPEGYDIRTALPPWKRPLFRLVGAFRPLDTGDRWYMLLGRLGPSGRPFQIGSRHVGTFTESGALYATVNDLRCAYGNNSGTVILRVFDLSP